MSPGHLLGVALVAEDRRVQVAVAGMAEGSDFEAVFFGQVVDFAEGFRQAAARHRGVLQQGGGGDSCQGGEGGAPGGGELRGLVGVAGRVDLGRPHRPQDVLHGLGLLGHHRRMAVDLDQQQSRHPAGQPDAGVILDAVDGGPIHDLQGRRNDLCGDDPRDRLSGGADVVEHGEKGLFGGRGRNELDRRLGEDAEGSLASDKKVPEGVAGHVLDALAAGLNDAAVGEDGCQSHHVIPGDTVLEPPKAPRRSRQCCPPGWRFSGNRGRGDRRDPGR